MTSRTLHVLPLLTLLALQPRGAEGRQELRTTGPPSAVRYEVDLSDTDGHRLEVTIHLDAVTSPVLTLSLPPWGPGPRPDRSAADISSLTAYGERSGILDVRRGGEVRELNLSPASRRVPVWRVVPIPDPTPGQQAVAVSILDPGH
ncbi:MAG: hypothetical protein R6W82_09115 [bacterium]